MNLFSSLQSDYKNRTKSVDAAMPVDHRCLVCIEVFSFSFLLLFLFFFKLPFNIELKLKQDTVFFCIAWFMFLQLLIFCVVFFFF